MPRATTRAMFLMLVLVASPILAEEVRIEHQGLTLNADLETADTWPGGPVVVLTHGTIAHRGMEIIAGLQQALAERGVATLAINLGLGIDDRPAAMYDCAVPHGHRHQDAAADVGAWVNWLKGQSAENVVVLGHSRGANFE